MSRRMERGIYYIGEFAEKIGVTRKTLQRWDNENFFPARRTQRGGKRYYTQEDYYKYLKLHDSNRVQKIVLSQSESKQRILSLKETLISLLNQISEIEDFL